MPETSDLLEESALIFLYNFHREHSWLKSIIKVIAENQCEKHKKLSLAFPLIVHARKIIQAYSKGDNYLLLHTICHIALINMPAMNPLNISKCIIVMVFMVSTSRETIKQEARESNHACTRHII